MKSVDEGDRVPIEVGLSRIDADDIQLRVDGNRRSLHGRRGERKDATEVALPSPALSERATSSGRHAVLELRLPTA